MLTTQCAPSIAALSPDQLKVFQKHINYFNTDSCTPGSTTGADESDGITGCCPEAAASADDALAGSDNEEKVWNYFIAKGLTPEATAGIMGNMARESGFDPQNIQDPAGRTKDPTPLTSTSQGWGLIQFTPGAKVFDWAKIAGVEATKDNVYLLSTQLDIVYGYMDHENLLQEFKNRSTDPHAAADAFEDLVENAGVKATEDRRAAADDAMKKYGQGATTGATPTASTGQTSTASGSICACPATGSADGTGTIVLDPGHSTFSDTSSRNALTGLYDTDTTGGPGEMHSAWVAANKIKPLLEKKGYTVKLTKNSEDESINLTQRAERANSTNGALLFTLHADSDVRWLAYPDKNSSRIPDGSGRRDGTNGLVHPDIMSQSKNYAEKMAPIIAKGISKGGDAYDAVSFNDYYGADGLAGNNLNKGNTPVQTILSSIPEVYSEVSPSDLGSDEFAQAAVDAISSVVTPSGGASVDPGAAGEDAGGCSSGAVPGDLLATVKNYAWPDYSSSKSNPKPEYKQAYDNAVAKGQYGGGGYTDCGAFVTRAMIDSGFEPNYNYAGKVADGAGPTPTEETWLKKNWQQIHPVSTRDLQPGDVAINDHHTFLYTGKIPNFHDIEASASLGGRVPMASSDVINGYTWYRKQ